VKYPWTEVESTPIRFSKRDSEVAAVRIIASGELPRRSISTALQGAGVPVAGTAADAEELLASDGTDPMETVVVAAESDPQLIEQLKLLRKRLPEARLVAVVSATTPRTLRALLDAGTDALVLDDRLEDQLAPTISAARSGQVCVPASARSALSTPVLSPREKQIMAMVVMGFTNREIANRLFLAESTIKSHLSSAFEKLGVRSRTAATARILDSTQGLGTGILSITEEEDAVASPTA
jgi:DNA-binding NarL/FixJ family response regulator